MAFTAINVAAATSGTHTQVAADSSNGNKFTNDGIIRLVIMNPDSASITCTIAVPAEADTALADGNVIADLAVATSAPCCIVKALNPQVYNVRSGTDAGAVTMTWTGTVTNVKLLVV
jgi:hypothetical protein